MDATESQHELAAPSGVWRWVSLAVLAAGVFGYIVVVTAPRSSMPGTQGPPIGRRLEHVQLEPLTGNAVAVSTADLDGRVTLLNYWGTWCGPCVAEFPHLVELNKEFAEHSDFRFYPVSCGGSPDEDLEELRAETAGFLRARRVELATFADPEGASRRSLSILLQLEQFAYPTTLVLDRQRRIRGFWVGYDPRAVVAMKTVIAALLSPAATP